MVPNKTPKVLTPTSKKTVCKISSADKGETVSAATANATLPLDITQPSTSSTQITQLSPDDDESVSYPGFGKLYSEN